jgi:endonuclease/exonuclease/phosphatase family metal-dependent hydrolase
MTIKIVCLNLWNGGRLFNEARDFLLQEAADIYLLQEAYDGRGAHLEDRLRTVELLSQAFPDYHASFTACYLDVRVEEGDIDDGNLILSRWPVVSQNFIFTDLPYGRYDQDSTTDFSNFPAGFQKVVIKIEGVQAEVQLLTLLNVHGPVNLNGTLDTPRRLKFQADILQHLGEKTIVAGDFNVQPATQTIKGLEEKLINVFQDQAHDGGVQRFMQKGLDRISQHQRQTSFNVNRKDLAKFPGYATAVVDYVFVTPNIRIKSYNVASADVSDHLPLVAVLEI